MNEKIPKRMDTNNMTFRSIEIEKKVRNKAN
eukprot:UN4029